ncbi:peptidase S9, prolyl oligopeptidase [Flavobacterium akiainvivens]|uniref:Peptidase S9, prolyl oligopeptidase n=1 Tax=Flavobacterium akiainvivens TaxID=1202724 RepID=A0A0M8MIF1_9FLAO|nr:alpha/beta fold hydrolase [Flavobacterium akiainvivens]KOS06871.1 peptidase S9, prolyl oligopeptidase [Flavobacterium akiainvivens]SFQ69340.1 Dipeptidyl aminopeptidase/acylaminoacyl peptidase [Flavobacterium akiainvivens]
MKHIYNLLTFGISLFALSTYAQEATIPVADNLVAKLPALPAAIAEDVKPYTDARSAGLAGWHPVTKEMFISTRFGNTAQIHRVAMPGGDRRQLTFFDEAPGGFSIQPTTGEYFLFSKDKGGDEFRSLYRYDIATGKSTLLAGAPRSQNGGVKWNEAGTKILYTSTRRNGADRDVYLMDPLDPSSDRKILEVTGGGWSIADWSKDEKLVLLTNYVSVNEVQTYVYDMEAGKLTKILPKKNERTVYNGIKFAHGNTHIFVLTTSGSEFLRPAIAEIKTGKLMWLAEGINWDFDAYAISKDGAKAAFVVNEAGQSKLYIQNITTKRYEAVTVIPTGVIDGVEWHNDNISLGITFGTATSSGDVYEYNTNTRKLTRWTESELGPMSLDGLGEPELVKWKSFDRQEISGFLYKANKKFTGKRPVIINIHGGPEGQSQPFFIGRYNYYLNELGVSILFPNVRGSVGYGKTFTDLDNGYKREDSVKDIGALLDWIATQPSLDPDRIMVMGGSYGGYMTLACATHYNDRIRCSVDIVGISNFNTFLKNTESYRRDLRRVEYGDERDPKMAAFFEKIAPLNNAGKITKPMFIIQGKNDPRVPYTEAEQMVQKIETNKGVVWYLMANDEGHGFRKKNNQDFQFYAVTAFVKEYLLK